MTFRLCWILWFICEIFMLGKRGVTIGGYGVWNLPMFFLFVVLIITWLSSLLLFRRWMCLPFDIKMSRWRLFCVCGVCFEIGCLQRTIFFVMELLVMILDCVSVGAVQWKIQLIYSYIVTILGQSGILSVVGLAWLRFCLCVVQTTFSNLALPQVCLRCGGPLFRLFGFKRCGKYWKKERTC